jgi:hypothetical protein
MAVTNTNSIAYKLVASGSILDLFDDEDILVSDNITGLFDVGTLPVDFSRTITLPATKKNNAFFEHVYDISIDTPYLFSTNTKVPAYLDFDGIYLVSGYIQLNKVVLKGDLGILSYEVSLFGLVSSFARDMDKNYLTDLTTLTKYNHTSSYNAITSSWSGSLFDGDIVYPLADYGSGYRFAQGGFQTFGINDFDGALSVQNFKPAIRIKKVWDACFEQYGYTYTGSFWNQPFLDDVYMICNTALKYPEYEGVDLETYGKIKVGAISGSGMTDFVLTSGSWNTLPWYNEISDPQNSYTNGAYTLGKASNLEGVLNININVSCSVNNMPGTFSQNGTWQLRMLETGSSTPYGLTAIQPYIIFFDQLQQSRTGGINTTYELQTQFKLYGIPTGSYYFQIRQSPNVGTGDLPVVTLDPAGTTKSYLEVRQVNQAADGRVLDMPTNMPYGTNGIKLIDFIKGVQKKFNLVIYPDKTKPNQMIVDEFNSWYKRGVRKDFNKYINLNDTIEVVPANNLAVNQLEFGDTLDQDYISQQFSKAANRPFGQSFYNDTQNYFSQGKLEVRTTFASSPLLQIANTGLSGSVEGANPTPPTTYFNYLSTSAYSNTTNACNHSGGYYTVYSSEQGINNITKLYTDYGLTTPFNGGYQYYRFIDTDTYQYYAVFVSYDGSVFASYLCGAQP